MSYSFSVRAATKAEAKAKVSAELDKVVSNQSIHSKDCNQALAAAAAFIDVLPDDDSKDITASVNGSVGWNGTLGVDQVISGASVGVNVYLVAKTVT